ncbi:MAG TPA: hypothetical protein VFA20_02970 [Myxococcaceae bacterium]|nr:hypothetical protein [Myxococcaceae bacterium]
MSAPGKRWPEAVVDRLSRLSFGRDDAALAELVRERVGWLEAEEQGEDLLSSLQDPARAGRGPTAEDVERLREQLAQLHRHAAEPAGRLKRAKAFVLRLLRLYTRPQLEWNETAVALLEKQDRALADLLRRVELLERGQRRLERGQR